MTNKVAYQGEPGAYSDLASRELFPDHESVPCATFDDAFAATVEGRTDFSVIPVENSVAGRVADIHHLIPDSPLHIVAEHFLSVRHQVIAPPGVTLDDIKVVRSHEQALAQCRRLINERGWSARREIDTAGAARLVANDRKPDEAALSSRLAAEIHGLNILIEDAQDEDHNTTRFLVFSREPARPAPGDGPCMTSFVFRVRNVPSALYKAMGGFATNGVNMTKLESYQLDGVFAASQFYADVEGHPDDPALARALEELDFFCAHLRIVGVYPAKLFRGQSGES